MSRAPLRCWNFSGNGVVLVHRGREGFACVRLPRSVLSLSDTEVEAHLRAMEEGGGGATTHDEEGGGKETEEERVERWLPVLLLHKTLE